MKYKIEKGIKPKQPIEIPLKEMKKGDSVFIPFSDYNDRRASLQSMLMHKIQIFRIKYEKRIFKTETDKVNQGIRVFRIK